MDSCLLLLINDQIRFVFSLRSLLTTSAIYLLCAVRVDRWTSDCNHLNLSQSFDWPDFFAFICALCFLLTILLRLVETQGWVWRVLDIFVRTFCSSAVVTAVFREAHIPSNSELVKMALATLICLLIPSILAFLHRKILRRGGSIYCLYNCVVIFIECLSIFMNTSKKPRYAFQLFLALLAKNRQKST